MRIVAFALAISCFSLVPAGAWAGPVANATLGATVEPVFGTHAEPDGTTTLDGDPLLTVEGSARYGNGEIYAEGIPPVGTIASSGSAGTLSTNLGFLFAVARAYVGPHVSLGIGTTVYHQTSLYGDTVERDISNIAGVRYEARGIERIGRSELAASFVATPVMRGGVTGQERAFVAFEAEHASQTEAILRDAYRIAEHVDLIAGVRYVNYVATYARTGTFADRNSGIAVVLGLRGRIGR